MVSRKAQPAQIRHQRLPSAGPEREALRQKGQFWTPDWVAQAMVEYVLRDGANHIFDPAVGAGAFFRAAKFIAEQRGKEIKLFGSEIDAEAIEEAKRAGLSDDDLISVEMRNFVLHPPTRQFSAIVANPPYIRHHRLPISVKAHLKTYTERLTGTALDGRAGMHVYFFLRALELLEDAGRLAFILPADTCEGKFAPVLWRWVTQHYRLDAVITFAPDATPFPSVDTNALIFLIQKTAPLPDLYWARCLEAQTPQLQKWTRSGFRDDSDESLTVQERPLSEALRTGLSRQPFPETGRESNVTLALFAHVMRGIATGDNSYFFLTSKQAQDLGIPEEYLRVVIGRTRDVTSDEITDELVKQLDARGRPTRLLSLDKRSVTGFPLAIQDYLAHGADLGLPGRALISQRKPWYRMETRSVPAFLFAYLGRRNTRFIRNTAGVLPLTGFLCIYPHEASPEAIEKLWIVLQHPDTIANLARVGKSYGSGAIKVEPRALESLPIPATALEAANIVMPPAVTQATLF